MSAIATELSVDTAVEQLCASIHSATEIERVPLRNASGRVLAADLTSHLDLPAFDSCAMDGYAVRSLDLQDGARSLLVISTGLAGHPAGGALTPGTCSRVMTGAALPAEADAVVIFEDAVIASDGQVHLPGPIVSGQHVRRRGEHVQRGTTVLGVGHRLLGPELGLATSVGHDAVTVFRQLTVGVMSTGDELFDPPAERSATGGYDANRAFLLDAAGDLSCVGHDLGICPDDPVQFFARLESAAMAGVDIVLTTGGAAQGDADIVRRLPDARFLPLNIRPGRGVVFAPLPLQSRHGKPLLMFGLPGNAVAAFVMFHLVVRRALLYAAGAQALPLTRLHLPLAKASTAKADRIDWRRGVLTAEGAVALLREQGSAMLRTVVDADLLVAIGPRSSYAAGDHVEAIMLRGAAC